ncbi:MAG: hypothetical protein ABIJ03_03635 [Patescibacteria group bacterium]|nr:hypothetical protein [Patescibacteria group bacterium]
MRTVLIWRLIGLTVGVGIVATSLLMAQDVNSGSDQTTSHKQLYFNSRILPDHTFYPVLMAVDRVKLLAQPKIKKPALLAEYGRHRWEMAHQLWEKNQPELALSTLLKSHHYLMQAVDQVIETNQVSQVSDLQFELESFADECSLLQRSIDLADKSAFEDMASQNTSARSRLEQLLKTEH